MYGPWEFIIRKVQGDRFFDDIFEEVEESFIVFGPKTWRPLEACGCTLI